MAGKPIRILSPAAAPPAEVHSGATQEAAIPIWVALALTGVVAPEALAEVPLAEVVSLAEGSPAVAIQAAVSQVVAVVAEEDTRSSLGLLYHLSDEVNLLT